MIQGRAFIIADDDRDVLKTARLTLAREAERLDLASSLDELEAQARGHRYDGALIDMNFSLGVRSGADGLDGLRRLREADPSLAVVLMTTWGGVALAVEALKRGALDFVLKPWRNEALIGAMTAAAEQTRSRREGEADLNLDELEKRAIQRALKLHEGNISHAAATLGLTRPALYRRMERHGL